jgi:hypothetical protein
MENETNQNATVETKKVKNPNFIGTSLKTDLRIKLDAFAAANNTNRCNAARMLIIKGLN